MKPQLRCLPLRICRRKAGFIIAKSYATRTYIGALRKVRVGYGGRSQPMRNEGADAEQQRLCFYQRRVYCRISQMD